MFEMGLSFILQFNREQLDKYPGNAFQNIAIATHIIGNQFLDGAVVNSEYLDESFNL